MNYSPDEYLAVADEIESQGGANLPDPCMPKDVVFNVPPYTTDRVKASTCGCKHNTRFAVEFNDANGKASVLEVCAVCDSLGAWPRFITAYEDAGGEIV